MIQAGLFFALPGRGMQSVPSSSQRAAQFFAGFSRIENAAATRFIAADA
jgi:hypothetical protein